MADALHENMSLKRLNYNFMDPVLDKKASIALQRNRDAYEKRGEKHITNGIARGNGVLDTKMSFKP